MRKHVSSGAPWEDPIGYCRALRVGNVIEVSGTAAVKDGKVVGENAYEQTKICLEIIEEALKEAGATLEHVVRTRIYVTDISQWIAVGKAHGEVFGNIKPATSMIEVSALIEPEMLVEVEATAIVE